MRRASSVAIVVRAPSACTSQDLAQFQQFVLTGGEVNPRTLPRLMSRAVSLALAKSDNQLVAVAAVKRPYASHRADVFAKARAPQDPTQFALELGWFYVHPSARGRGIASDLAECLVDTLQGAPAYATSRADNNRMRASLTRLGFKPVGTAYSSSMTNARIQLFLCESPPTLRSTPTRRKRRAG